jgi:putative addiction module killer protein
MPVIHRTADFDDWLRRLADERAKARIASRIERLRQRNAGDCKSLGRGVWEMRVDYGPGYRVYFKYRGPEIVLLLCGGDKRTQRRDIKRAQDLAEQDDA